ncbi:MAG: DUF4317 domain-containing protein [Lachnospiraceae bacterium]|nr:DUF4317 domain-containing protein [Lachnospiraceae bacterium]
MTKNEIAEIKKLFTIEGCTIDRIAACYVGNEKEKMSVMKEAFLSLPEEEVHKYLEILKKVLSGRPGKNLLDLEFPLAEEVEGGKQDFMLTLRNSALTDDDLIDDFYDRIIESYDTVERYYIILVHGGYDIPGKTSDGLTMEDASEDVYDFLAAAICPVKLSKAALSYNAGEHRIAERIRDWVVAEPEKGFLYPAFDDRTANIHGLLYYSRKSEELMEDFIDGMFGMEVPMSAGYQAEVFNHILDTTLGEECAFETVQSIHENLEELIKDSEEDPEPLMMDKREVRKLFERSGVKSERMEDFDWKFDKAVKEALDDEEADPEEALIRASNIPGRQKFDVKTPDIVIRVNPERTDLIESRIIDGRQCLVIKVDDRVEVNGLTCRTVIR